MRGIKLGTFASSGAAAFFQGIVKWLIGADSGKLYASQDGTTFLEVNQTAFGTSNVNDVFYGTDLSNPIYASWTTTAANQLGNIIVYGNGIWVANPSATSFITSTDTINWTVRSSNFSGGLIKAIAYGNNLWAAASSNAEIRRSTDSITWTTVTTNWTTGAFNLQSVQSLGYGNGIWIAAGFYLNPSYSVKPVIRRSTDTITWSTVTAIGNASLNTVYYGNGLWVAGGDQGNMSTSTDGITWTTRNSNFGTSAINSIAYGNGLWVAINYDGLTFRTSTDAINWTTISTPNNVANVNQIAYANGLWMMTRNDKTPISSTNGINWYLSDGTENTIKGMYIAYGNNVWTVTGTLSPGFGAIYKSSVLSNQYSNAFLAAGNAGKLAKSTDGLTWSTLNIGGTDNYQSIAYGNGLYYAGG